MDGQNRRVLLDNCVSIADVTLDSDNQLVYFCDAGSKTIERIEYGGKEHVVLLNDSLEKPVALTVFDGLLYWTDSVHMKGSIRVAPVANLTRFKVIEEGLGESLKDIQVFSKRKQRGTNPCAVDNGGCEQLCFFNGTHPNAIGLTFSYKHHRLFYSDIQKGSINAVYFNGSDHKVIVERQGSVEGLAYEQLHNALYWTCNNDATINRVNLTDRMENGSLVETIVRLRIQDKPRGIAVDSCGARVYWTNWNSYQPSIERAFLSGYRREAIIKTDIRMPNAITLDHKAQKLYWGDARLDKIERCEYDGTKRIVLAKVTPQHPFALAVYGDFIYWTDWMLHAVIRADKFTGQYVVLLRRDVARPMGIVTVANDTDDCFSNPCLIRNGGCGEICALRAAGTVECSCFEDRVLSEDGRCKSKVSSNCSNSGDSFRCSDGGCVPFHLTCDGVPHCADQSDEEPGYCGYRTCPLGWFQCQNKMCISRNLTCNEVDDCGDSSDEMSCPCNEEDHFRCANGQCILNYHRCDHDPDCQDKSDEIGCGE
ncbi:hypothetical protein NQ318_023104 [Aromia moschata]|uniref:Uncharacterized protein n=1 Tax=Aromia moschata TaxID=1265417 RepID=A0AAV8XFY9_9CUCU|nr:hypothetical protein NQ318_023104 [Aromia moschata]